MEQNWGWRHHPCPHCKEPEPIRSRWPGLIFGFLLLAFFGALIWMIFFFDQSGG